MLTEEQRSVVRLESGPARVLAGAGSGKTHTMTEFVARKVRDHSDGDGGVAPERILAITFTVKAADEMRERLLARIGEPSLKLTVSNFHSLAFNLARENAVALGIPADAPVLRQARAWLMVLEDLASEDLSLRRLDLSNPAGVAENTLKLLGEARNELVGLDAIREKTQRDLEAPRTTDEMRRVFEARLDLVKLAGRFEEKRVKLGLLQYQDMVEIAVRVLEDGGLGQAYRGRYDLVVVDEFQDTNPAQMRLVELLADGDASKVVVIGDDLQSIFNFQGAAIRNIQNFENWARPRTDGGADGEPKRVNYSLTKNFRSARRILTLANHIAEKVHPPGSPDAPKILAPRDDAPEGEIFAFAGATDIDEAGEMARRIESLVGEAGDYSTCAVLLRKWSQAAPVVASLTEAGIPCEVVRGGDLLARNEIRHLTDHLRLVQEPGYVGASLVRTLLRPPYLFSDGDLRCVFEYPDGPWRAMLETDSIGGISDGARERLRRLRATLSELEGERSASETLAEFVERAVEVAGLGREVRSSPDKEARLAEHHLAAFREIASEFGAVERLGEFLRYLKFSENSRTPESAEPPEVSGDAVVLTTIHRAKGLEFDHVFIPGLSASHFPNDNGRRIESPLKVAHRVPPSLKPDPDPQASAAYEAFNEVALKEALKREADEEEGRLFYVAATRARETLTLSRACYYSDNRRPKKPGLFWEMTQDAPASCAVPAPEEPDVPPENPNLPVFGVVERPEPDGFPLLATKGTKSEEAGIASELGVTGYEDALTGFRMDVESIPEVERPEYILPTPEVHSPSSLMEFESCPRRYYYRNVFPVVDITPEGEEGRDYGAVWHKWIEDGMKGDQPPPPTEPDEKPSGNPEFRTPTVPLKQTEYGIKASTYPLHENDVPPETGPKKMVEVPFAIEVGGQEIRGRIDAVFVDEDGTCHIVDWKSGRPKDLYRNRLQLPIYGVVANRLWNIKPENIRLAYVFASGEKIEVPFGADAIEATEQKINRNLTEIKSGGFPPKPSRYACRYCPVFGVGIEGCPKDKEELKGKEAPA